MYGSFGIRLRYQLARVQLYKSKWSTDKSQSWYDINNSVLEQCVWNQRSAEVRATNRSNNRRLGDSRVRLELGLELESIAQTFVVQMVAQTSGDLLKTMISWNCQRRLLRPAYTYWRLGDCSPSRRVSDKRPSQASRSRCDRVAAESAQRRRRASPYTVGTRTGTEHAMRSIHSARAAAAAADAAGAVESRARSRSHPEPLTTYNNIIHHHHHHHVLIQATIGPYKLIQTDKT